MQVTVFIFQICAVTIAVYCVPGNGEGGWLYFEEAKLIDSERVFPRLRKAFAFCILVRDIFWILQLIVLNKTCKENQMLWKQRRLFSRKCAVEIHEAMVNITYKNYSRLHFLTGSLKNDSGGSGFEQQRRWRFFWTDSWTVRTKNDYFLLADNPSLSNGWQFFQTDRLSRSNGYQIFGKAFHYYR